MENYIYETHNKDPLLPFIFHKQFDISARDYSALNWHGNIELLYCIGGSVCAVADIRLAVLGLIRSLCSAYSVPEQGSPQKVSIVHVKRH